MLQLTKYQEDLYYPIINLTFNSIKQKQTHYELFTKISEQISRKVTGSAFPFNKQIVGTQLLHEVNEYIRTEVTDWYQKNEHTISPEFRSEYSVEDFIWTVGFNFGTHDYELPCPILSIAKHSHVVLSLGAFSHECFFRLPRETFLTMLEAILTPERQ